MALCGIPDSDSPLFIRLVGRAYFGLLLRSDAMWSERLHWETATDLAPEMLAERGRELFSATS